MKLFTFVYNESDAPYRNLRAIVYAETLEDALGMFRQDLGSAPRIQSITPSRLHVIGLIASRY